MDRVTRLTSYGVLVQDAKLLLCRLSNQTATPGRWTLPGGGLEFGESPEAALFREVTEETGLTVKSVRFMKFLSETEIYGGRQFHLIRFFYDVPDFSGTLKSELDGTTDRCEWIPLAALDSVPTVRIVKLALKLHDTRGNA